LKFGELQMLNLAGLGPFERNAEQALGLGQVFGMLGADITEEAVDGAQAHITGADPVISFTFQVVKEGRDLINGELFERECAGVALFPSREL
jgi:hypothetical protein